MSIDVLIFPIEGRFAGRDIAAMFGEYASETEYGLLVEYEEDEDCSLFFTLDEAGTTDSFCVNRPCGDERLCEALFAFLRDHATQRST